MEADRRKLDIANVELMKALKLEVNNHVGRILESYRSGNGEDGSGRKSGKHRSNEGEPTGESEGDSVDFNKKIRL